MSKSRARPSAAGGGDSWHGSAPIRPPRSAPSARAGQILHSPASRRRADVARSKSSPQRAPPRGRRTVAGRRARPQARPPRAAPLRPIRRLGRQPPADPRARRRMRSPRACQARRRPRRPHPSTAPSHRSPPPDDDPRRRDDEPLQRGQERPAVLRATRSGAAWRPEATGRSGGPPARQPSPARRRSPPALRMPARPLSCSDPR
jgi:hypothetical protein